MYNGKEVCQGCKKTGVEVPRYQKTQLCQQCEKALKAGLSELHERNIEYVGIRQWYHAFGSVEWDDKSLNEAIIALIKSVHNPHAKCYDNEPIKAAHADNCLYANIPKLFLEPLRKFGKTMDGFVTDLRNKYENLPRESAKEVQKEKDRIYNEGIEQGRDLLFQLNSGAISIDDFNKKLTYKRTN